MGKMLINGTQQSRNSPKPNHITDLNSRDLWGLGRITKSNVQSFSIINAIELSPMLWFPVNIAEIFCYCIALES